METYITICKIDSQQEFAVLLRKLKHGICINQGWGGGNGGKMGWRLRMKGYMYTYSLFMLRFDRKKKIL